MATKATWRSVLVAFLLIAPLAALRGFVLSRAWAWLAVPLFDAPALSVGKALALSFLVQAFSGVGVDTDGETALDSMIASAWLYLILLVYARVLAAVVA